MNTGGVFIQTTAFNTGGGFPGGSDGKESACNVGDLGSTPGLGRSPGERSSYPLQYSGLESGSFPVSQLFALGGQSIEASASVLPMNSHD